MTSPYASVSVSGYNSNPPPDDGTTGANNKIQWAGIKSKLTDPFNTYAAAQNTACVTAFGKTLDGAGTATSAVDYPAGASDQGRLIVVTASGKVVTTPDATVVLSPFVFGVLNRSTGNINVTGNNPGVAQTVDGSTTQVLGPGQGCWIETDGANWFTSGLTSQPPGGTTGTRPGSPAVGYTRYNTTLNGLEYWNGTAWIVLGQQPTVQAFASGAGTYTAAAGVVRQRVRLVGGGGGGGARTTTAGTNGTSSSFQVNGAGTAWTAVFGSGGAIAGAGGAGGASGNDGTGTRIIRCFGADGGACSMQVDATGDSQSAFTGGAGGSSILGGAGMPAATTGGSAKTNSGSGGAGGNSSVGTKGGGGGGAAEYVEFWVAGMTTATYTVGAKGTGGAAGGSAGGDGAAGIIVIEEFYS